MDYYRKELDAESNPRKKLVNESNLSGELLRAAFPVQCRFNGRDLFEADNLLVWLAGSDLPSSTFLAVEVAKPIPRVAIPAFLWECAHTSGSPSGMFIPNEDREQV